jgi:hypothetical protein
VNDHFSQVYHSRAETVYHTDPSCPIGRQIPSEWLVSGPGSLNLCPACRMRADARSASGTYLRPTLGGEE